MSARILFKLVVITVLMAMLFVFSVTEMDFVYTGF